MTAHGNESGYKNLTALLKTSILVKDRESLQGIFGRENEVKRQYLEDELLVSLRATS